MALGIALGVGKHVALRVGPMCAFCAQGRYARIAAPRATRRDSG